MTLPKKHRPLIQPLKTIIYGESGIGKTTFAASAPNCVIIPVEDGLSRIDAEFDSFDIVDSTQKFMDCLKELSTNEELHYETLVVDSLNWLESIVLKEVCERFNEEIASKVDKGFGRADEYSLNVFKKITGQLNYLKAKKKMNIILITHFKKVKTIDLTVGDISFNRYELDLSSKNNDLFTQWADNVLFAARKNGNSIGEEGNPRALFCTETKMFYAKNRIGAPPCIPLKYSAYEKYAFNNKSSQNEKIENNSTELNNKEQ